MANNLKTVKRIEKYEAKDFSYLFATLHGISEDAMKLHYKLYEGYVTKSNEVAALIKECDKSKANHNFSEIRGLLIDKTHNLNGVVLHEMFFSNLSDEKTEPSEPFKEAIIKDFGSWDNYIQDIKATAKASRAGWAITAYHNKDGRIHNFAIDQHNLYVPIFISPLLIIDVWEHAYTTDFGTDKPKYIDTITENLDWCVVSRRYENI